MAKTKNRPDDLVVVLFGSTWYVVEARFAEKGEASAKKNALVTTTFVGDAKRSNPAAMAAFKAAQAAGRALAKAPALTAKEKAEIDARLAALPMALLRKVTTGEWTLDEAEAEAERLALREAAAAGDPTAIAISEN
jgi:hypothetical protein